MERASILARRYAEAYFALAQEADDIAGWREQLAAVAETLGDPAVSDALANPKTSLAERVTLGLQAARRRVRAEARNLARLLIERRRVGIAGEILTHYDASPTRLPASSAPRSPPRCPPTRRSRSTSAIR